jgi:hypothetical protein
VREDDGGDFLARVAHWLGRFVYSDIGISLCSHTVLAEKYCGNKLIRKMSVKPCSSVKLTDGLSHATANSMANEYFSIWLLVIPVLAWSSFMAGLTKRRDINRTWKGSRPGDLLFVCVDLMTTPPGFVNSWANSGSVETVGVPKSQWAADVSLQSSRGG